MYKLYAQTTHSGWIQVGISPTLEGIQEKLDKATTDPITDTMAYKMIAPNGDIFYDETDINLIQGN